MRRGTGAGELPSKAPMLTNTGCHGSLHLLFPQTRTSHYVLGSEQRCSDKRALLRDELSAEHQVLTEQQTLQMR